MNKDTPNYKTDRPQIAGENIDFYNDKVLWSIKALVIPALVLVYSIGLPSTVGATDNSLPKNRPNVAAIKIEVDPRVELVGIVFRLAGAIPPPTRSLNMAWHFSQSIRVSLKYCSRWCDYVRRQDPTLSKDCVIHNCSIEEPEHEK